MCTVHNLGQLKKKTFKSNTSILIFLRIAIRSENSASSPQMFFLTAPAFPVCAYFMLSPLPKYF